jgi:D-xylose transport system substrate-binding protein
MSINRTFPLFIVVFLGVIMASCGKKSGPTIGFMLPHMTIKRYLIERDEFTRKVKELGGEVIFMSADNDEHKQMLQEEELLKKNIDILVLDPVNRFSAAEMVRKAHDKGIKVISYDRLVANCDVDAFLTFDPSAIGVKMAQFSLNKIPEGNYFILGGDKTDINAVMIDEAIHKTLAASPKAAIIYTTYIEKYLTEDAENEVDRFLNLSMDVPDAILASSDALAKGALLALQKKGVQKQVLITGQNADAYSCKAILEGRQAMTIYKPIKKMAAMAAEIAVNLTKGMDVNGIFKRKLFNGSKEVPSTFLDVIVIDAQNLRSTVVADGLLTEAELK